MEQKITRTFKFTKIVIRDAKSGEVLKEETTTRKPDKKKIAIAFIKETGNTSFVVEVIETEEIREMSLDTFLANSTVVKPKENH